MSLPESMWFFHKQKHSLQDALNMRSNSNVRGGFVSSVFLCEVCPRATDTLMPLTIAPAQKVNLEQMIV